MVFIKYELNKHIFEADVSSYDELKTQISKSLNISVNDFYLLNDGRLFSNLSEIKYNSTIRYVLRLAGGKGGFGSMLRAIGAQIEKTTNREACRDLSGRRLRDINEEKRLKNWIASQADREREALERKQKKLERLCVQPKHKFEDSKYEKLRSELPEKVSDAVEQGFKMATSSGSNSTAIKRKSENKTAVKKNKKSKLWVDPDLSCSDSDDADDSENEEREPKELKQNNILSAEENEIANKSFDEQNTPEKSLVLSVSTEVCTTELCAK